MDDIYFLVWLFPVLFIFHDFEEIIFMKSWIVKNSKKLSQSFPKLSKKMLPHFNSLTTSSFALGVAEEFILISIITIVSYLTGWYYLWIGVFIAFGIHLVMHCVQGIVFKSYVPALVTSVICLPICFYVLVLFLQLYHTDIRYIVFFSIVGFVVMIANLWVVHRCMNAFDKWLVTYQNGR